MRLSREQAEIIEALRLEPEPLARINLQIIGLGGQPITPRPQYLAQLREQKPQEVLFVSPPAGSLMTDDKIRYTIPAAWS